MQPSGSIEQPAGAGLTAAQPVPFGSIVHPFGGGLTVAVPPGVPFAHRAPFGSIEQPASPQSTFIEFQRRLSRPAGATATLAVLRAVTPGRAAPGAAERTTSSAPTARAVRLRRIGRNMEDSFPGSRRPAASMAGGALPFRYGALVRPRIYRVAGRNSSAVRRGVPLQRLARTPPKRSPETTRCRRETWKT